MAQNTIDPILEDKLNELYHLTIEIDEKTKKKAQLRTELLPLIKKHKLESRSFAIGTKVIKYKNEKQTGGLTQKLLLNSLTEYYGPTKTDEATKVYKFILGKREQKFKESVSIDNR